MEFHKGIIRKWSFSYNCFVKLSLYNMIHFNIVHTHGLKHSFIKGLCYTMYHIYQYFDLHDSVQLICVKQPLSKRSKIGFQDQLSLNVGQKYCRMLQGEHSGFQDQLSLNVGQSIAECSKGSILQYILSTFIELPFVIKIFVLSHFEWP